MMSGYVTYGFKRSYIVPIPKVKDCRTRALTCDDFRGIAISPIICKVFEHCLLNRLKKFLASADNQFGFRKGVGCNHAIYTVHKIVDKLVSNGYTAKLCTINLFKAFDKVNYYALFLLTLTLLAVLAS